LLLCELSTQRSCGSCGVVAGGPMFSGHHHSPYPPTISP
jgi:hypothetical protein